MMTKSLALVPAAVTILIAGCVQEPRPIERHDRLAIVGANVVNVDAAEVLPGRTVMVEDGVIRWIDLDGLRELPTGTYIVDAGGGYLIPGLADLHIHHFIPWLEGDRGLFQRRRDRPYDERDLMLYPVNGVTLVRVMAGSSRDLEARSRIESGELLGPRYVVCSPQITVSWNARPVAELADSVRSYHRQGYDCLKVYSGPDEERFLRVIALGDSLGLHTTGHAQVRLPFEHTLRYGSIEHIEEIQHFFDWGPVNEEEHGPLVDALVASGARVTTTIGSVYVYRYLDDEEYAALVARESARYVPSAWIQDRDRFIARYRERGADMDSLYHALKRIYETGIQIAGFLHARGVPLLMGTDGGPSLITPGFSALDELETLVRAGLSPAAALRTATSVPADFLGTAGGRIAPGHDADLVLLAANPLTDISNVRRIRGVLVAGTWLDDGARQAILRELRRR